MKKIYLLLLMGSVFISTQAQDRVYWSAACPTTSRMAASSGSMAVASSSVANPSASTTGWFQGAGNPTTGAVTPGSDSYNSTSIKPEYGIAVSPSGFLYGIAGSFNQSTNSGVIQLAYKSALTLDNTAPLTTTAFDLNGSSTNGILPAAVGISTTGKGGFIYYDGSAVKYCSFTANSDGSVTWGSVADINFSNTDDPTGWNNDGNIGDLVFDDAGNLYVLAERYNSDYSVMQNVVYSVPAASLTSAPLTAPLKWIITDTKSLSFGQTNGLGYASGTFYISQSETSNSSTYTNYITAIQPPATGTSVVLGSNYTTLTGYCEINDLAVIAASVLPADWGSVDAFIQNGQLKVNWQTLKEISNDHFEVEVSGDGKTFSSIGKVNSKAINGNNDTVLDYTYSIDLNNVALGFSAVAALMLFVRRKKILLMLTTALGIIAIVQIGCSKSNQELASADSNLFVRIAQIDKDGKKTYSKVIQVRK